MPAEDTVFREWIDFLHNCLETMRPGATVRVAYPDRVFSVRRDIRSWGAFEGEVVTHRELEEHPRRFRGLNINLLLSIMFSHGIPLDVTLSEP